MNSGLLTISAPVVNNRKAVAFPVSASHNTMSPWSQSGYEGMANTCNSVLLYMPCCNNILLLLTVLIAYTSLAPMPYKLVATMDPVFPWT